MKKDSILYVIIFTFLVCVAFVIPLAAANELTKGKVEANKRYAAHVAVLKAFELADSSTPAEEVESIYASQIKELAGKVPAYRAEIDGRTYLAVQNTGPGLWGSITAIIAADAKATRLRGIEILDQNETPGLGGRIAEDWFKDQFRGEKIGPAGISVDQAGTGKGDLNKDNSRVDAVTGASRTSDFIKAIVNHGIADIRSLGGEQ